MSSARDLLDQRLAKGEITEQEYDRLVAKFSNDISLNDFNKKSEYKKYVNKIYMSLFVIGLIFAGHALLSKENDMNLVQASCNEKIMNCSCVDSVFRTNVGLSEYILMLGDKGKSIVESQNFKSKVMQCRR